MTIESIETSFTKRNVRTAFLIDGFCVCGTYRVFNSFSWRISVGIVPFKKLFDKNLKEEKLSVMQSEKWEVRATMNIQSC